MKKVGIFAGTFDPIHDGHLEVARSALKHLELDKVLIMVEANPWTNKKPASVEHRIKMVEIATKNELNIEHHKEFNDRFTISETLPKLESQYLGEELYFIFGADVFMNMNPKSWPDLQRLLKHYIVVFERKSITEKELTEHAKKLGIVTAILPSKHMEHTSSMVRMQSHRKQIWVPKKVADYIDKHNLYKQP